MILVNDLCLDFLFEATNETRQENCQKRLQPTIQQWKNKFLYTFTSGHTQNYENISLYLSLL